MTHRETGYAQILLSAIFIAGYFWVLSAFIDGKVRVPVDWKDAVMTLLGVLTASVVQVFNYWFARQRTSTEPGGAG
jgi:hypothetical protein